MKQLFLLLFMLIFWLFLNMKPLISQNKEHSIRTLQGQNSSIEDFKVNDDVGSYNQDYPAIALDSRGNSLIIWQDEWIGNSNIYGQRYNANIIPLGSNFKVNDDMGSGYQHYHPVVEMYKDVGFVVAWEVFHNGESDIYYYLYYPGWSPPYRFCIVNDIISSNQSNPAIAIDDSGNFVIVWEDDRDGNYDIYGQRYNSSGIAQRGNFKVNDDASSSKQLNSAIGMDGNGNFLIVWQDERNGNCDIYGQRYNSSGIALGSNFKITDDLGNSDQVNPVIAMNSNGDFVLAWEDSCNVNADIYIIFHGKNGTKTEFKVNDDTESNRQCDPAVTIDDSGNFVVAWEDNRNGLNDPDIYAQRFDNNGQTRGNNYRVNNDQDKNIQQQPDVKLVNNFIYYSWADNRITG